MNWGIFRDQIWNFIGVIIAVVTLLITVIIYFLQRNKKGLSYEIISQTPLLTSKEKHEGKIKVLYNDTEVSDVKFLKIRVINTGNTGITSSDYERPLRFIFATETKILSSEVVESNPETLTAELTISSNEIIVSPVLMNGKDSFTIKTILSEFDGDEIIVDARIKDVKSIKKLGENYFNIAFAFIGLILTITGLVQLIRQDKSLHVESPWTFEKAISISLIILGYVFMIAYLLRRKGKSKEILLSLLRPF
jgi:hypothetical protein